MSDLVTEFRQALADHPQIRRWVIGFSGGLDSTVLLLLASRELPASSVQVLHVHHHLQPAADGWAERALALCRRLQLPVDILHVTPSGCSEAAARKARYQAFADWLQPDDCLLLGHHAGDQSETLLFRLMRGTGVRGLCGIPRSRALGTAQLLRPLLGVPRAQLERWAIEQGADWIEDPSNQRTDFDRNYLRHQILAPLRARWPGIDQRLADTAGIMLETQALIEEVAAQDLAELQLASGALDLNRLQTLSPARQHNLLRVWVGQTGQTLNQRDLAELRQQFLHSREDAQPQMRLGGYWLRRYREQLFLLPVAPADARSQAEPLAPISLVQARRYRLPGGELEVVPVQGADESVLPELTLAYRAGGEVLYPAGKGFSVSLKQLFQDAGVPPWLRQDWPLLMMDDQIAAVPGLCKGELLADYAGLNFIWRPFSLSGRAFFASL